MDKPFNIWLVNTLASQMKFWAKRINLVGYKEIQNFDFVFSRSVKNFEA